MHLHLAYKYFLFYTRTGVFLPGQDLKAKLWSHTHTRGADGIHFKYTGSPHEVLMIGDYGENTGSLSTTSGAVKSMYTMPDPANFLQFELLGLGAGHTRQVHTREWASCIHLDVSITDNTALHPFTSPQYSLGWSVIIVKTTIQFGSTAAEHKVNVIMPSRLNGDKRLIEVSNIAINV